MRRKKRRDSLTTTVISEAEHSILFPCCYYYSLSLSLSGKERGKARVGIGERVTVLFSPFFPSSSFPPPPLPHSHNSTNNHNSNNVRSSSSCRWKAAGRSPTSPRLSLFSRFRNRLRRRFRRQDCASLPFVFPPFADSFSGDNRASTSPTGSSMVPTLSRRFVRSRRE
jgi:hypothetical protein